MKATARIFILLSAALFISQLFPGYVNKGLEEVAAPVADILTTPEKITPSEENRQAQEGDDGTLAPAAPKKIPARIQPQAAIEPQPPPTETPAPPPSLPSEPALSDQEIYSRYSRAVIQIYCQTVQEIFSASGIILNERGLVLTNAHVAEIVRKAGENNCQARHGNPADPFAKIKIVFAADVNPKISGTEVPQRDIAFLKIQEAIESFTVADISTINAERGETLLTLGYPSEFLQGINTTLNSNLVFSALRVEGFADIDEDRTTADGYVFRGGLALQQGSSGTALFKRSGKVVGVMFATTKEKTTDERQGVALSFPYIDKIMRLETGQGLAEFIASH